jgi:hypothetical protein
MRRGNLFPTRVAISRVRIRYKHHAQRVQQSFRASDMACFPEAGQLLPGFRGGRFFGARCRLLGQAKNSPRPTKAANTRSMGRRVY